MKILVIGRASEKIAGNSVGGIAKHIEDLSCFLASRKVDVTVFDYTLSVKESYCEGVKVVGVPLIKKLINLFWMVFYASQFFRELKNYSVKDIIKVSVQLRTVLRLLDEEVVVHVHSLHDPVSYFLSAKKCRKLVITDHGFWQHSREKMTKLKKTIRKLRNNISVSDHIIYISDYSKEKLLENELWCDRMLKLPNPVNFNRNFFLINNDISEVLDGEFYGRKIIFFNGFNESVKRKGLDVLLKAFSSSPYIKENCCLIAICDSEGASLIRKDFSSYPILALGSQKLDVLDFIYRKCDCLVVPSKSESFGLIYIEALSYGKPIIGFDSVVSEFQKMTDTCIGIGFSPKEDHLLLGKHVKSVLTNIWDSEKLVAVAKMFSWEDKIMEFIDLYNAKV